MFHKENTQKHKYEVKYISSNDITKEGFYIINNKNIYTRIFRKEPLCLVYDNIIPFSIATETAVSPIDRDSFRIVINTALKYNYENTLELLKSIQEEDDDVKIKTFIFFHSYLKLENKLLNLYDYNKQHIDNMITKGEEKLYDIEISISDGIKEVETINKIKLGF